MVAPELRHKEFFTERPFYGYGMNPPDVKWPTGGKVCVAFVIEYTEGGEMSVEYGDKHSETLFPDLVHMPSREARDDYIESEWEYGPRAGLPRLLRLFKKFSAIATINVVTSALEKSPYWAKELPKTGHELSCASHRWINYFDVTPEKEEQHIATAIQSLQKRLYARANKEAGLPLLYSADSFADDLPFWIQSPLSEEGEEDEGMLLIPSALDCSDILFNVKGAGWSSGEDFLAHLTDAYDTLYQEGVDGEAKMMTIQLHPRIIGRAGRIAYLEKFLQYITEKGGAWIASREQIATFWRKEYPYDPENVEGKIATDLVKNKGY